MPRKTISKIIVIIILIISTAALVSRKDYFISEELLGRPGNKSVSIEFVPAMDLEIYAEYGKSSGNYSSKTGIIKAEAEITTEIKISKLKSNKHYYYRLRYREPGEEDWLTGLEHSFQTQRKKKEEFTFAVIADSHLDQPGGIDGFLTTLQNISKDKPDFLIDLGDTFMSDRLSKPNEANIKERLLEVRGYFKEICHSIPLFLAMGNHEGENGYYLNKPRRKSLAITATLLRKEYFPNPIPDSFYSGCSIEEDEVGLRENYYAWTWGSALFVVLDPHWYTKTNPMTSKDNWDRTLGKEQYDWLEKTLKKSKASFKCIFLHNLTGGLDNYGRGGAEAAPYYEWGGANADGSDGFSQNRSGWKMPVHQLLKKYGVQVVFHGHDHSYAYQEYDGIIYQLCPQPGKAKKETIPEALKHGYKDGVILTGTGHLRVTVSKREVKVEFVQASSEDDNYKVLHQWQIDK